MPRDEEETPVVNPKPKKGWANPTSKITYGRMKPENDPRNPNYVPKVYTPKPQQQDYREGQYNRPPQPVEREQSIEEKLGQQPVRQAPVKYYTDQTTGLTRKMKLPGALSGSYRAPSVTMDKVQSGQANWTDVFTAERERILADPNFYKTNQITQYEPFIQQQIIADKAFDWTQVPKWQRPFYEASSRPAVAGAVQGLIMGMGNPGGAVAGAALGAAAQATGYDQTKEAWEQGDGKFTWNVEQIKEIGKGAFGWLNYAAELAEKTIGTAAMAVNAAADPNKEVKDVLNKDTFNANASFFEVIAPAMKAAQQGDGRITINDAQKLIPALWQAGVVADLVMHPEKYQGEEYYLGASMPVELQQTWTERIEEARTEIAKGRDYREVMTEMQTGIMAQIGDMAGQGVFDPLNVMPKVQTGVIRKGAELAGNKVVTEAFTNVETTREGIQKFRNIVQTGEAAKIDPTFDAQKLNGFEKAIAGLNKQGEVKAGGLTKKGLLDPADPKKPQGGLFEETPQSRAQTGATMFDRNIGTLMTLFKDPTEAVGYIRKIAGGDMNAWKEMGSRVGNSPEWYTILPALKDFSADKLEGLAKAWEVTAINRDALTRVADVLGDNPTKLIDDWASRNNTDQDFARIIQRAKEANTPESNALLKEFESGTFTPDTLKQIVDLFHGEGALPHTEAQWKWAMYADMSDHFAEWVAQHLLLDKSPEATSSFFQTMAVFKQAQSIILLGASPGYAIQNGLSGIVHLATDGIYGSMTPRQMDEWITRWETPIPRLDEGVGIGGMVDAVRSNAISDAMKPGAGPLTDLKQTLSRIQRGMPMSKLSSKFESVNSKRGYVTGIKKFWANSWRRGVGFRKMDNALAKVLTDAGIDPNRIYAAIEAGANQKEIERALTGQYKGMQTKALINDAAQAAGITPAQAAEMLDTIGLTETLDTFLAGADTPDRVDAAFTRANKRMQDWIDMKYGERLKTRAEEVKNIVGREGMAAGLNVAQQASNQFYDAWFDHYARFGDVMGGLDGLEPAQRSKVIEEAYRQSDTNFRRVFASMGANYQGIFDVWGLSGDPDATSAVHAISDMNNSMKEAYDFMRQKRNELSATLNREDRAPTYEELRAVNMSVDKAFDKAFKAKHAAEIRMGNALQGVYTKLHGTNAGNAARLWWNDVMQFSEKIVADEKRFRAEQDTAREMGASRASLSDAKKKYYSENKQRWIADLQKINDDGIARLERIVKDRGGDATPTPAPTEPTPPSGAGPAPSAAPKRTKAQEKAAAQQEEINKMLADVKQIDAAEKAERARQVESVWNVAEGYWNRGGNYSRATVQDRFSLLVTLNKPEYGGIPDLMGLHDPRLDSETVTRILDTRKAVMEAEKAKAEPPSIREIKKRKSKDSANVNILDAIRSYGGLNIAKITDYARDKKVGSLFGVFQKQAYSKGWDIDQMATRLAGDGFPIDLADPNDPGGVTQTQALLDRALAGEQIYPTTHDYTANVEKINAAELAHIEALKADEAAFAVEPFDADTWKARMQEAIAKKDGEAVDTLFGELPDELSNTAHDADGETYAEYILRAQNNIEADAINDARATAIATAKTQAETAVKDSEARAEAVTTRTLMLEKWTEIFGAEQAQAYMEMSDAIAYWWYEQGTGGSADEFYSRYYEDARRDVEADVIGELEQSYRVGENVQNRTLSAADAQNYSRMLARSSESEARSAIRNEGNKADRIAILKALYEINPDMAENVARAESDMLRQAEGMGAKGAVTFGADGIRATIHAFEAADFSTLVHENAHVFRRVMKDVAERTGNKQVVKDLSTIEEWAGVKDGVWTVPAEEKFARGFENYIATGEAPTPKLRKAFETFKGWMLQVYRTITGSAIDVKISDEVKGVFDRMLGGEGQKAEGGTLRASAEGGGQKAGGALFQRNKAQVAAAQFDMFAESARMKAEGGEAEGKRTQIEMIQKDYAMKPKDLSTFVDDIKKDIYANHRMDVAIEGSILEAYHPVTGNKMMSIDFERGEVTAKNEKYQAQAEDIKTLVEDLVFKKKAGMELANLKNYPGKNAEIIKTFESLTTDTGTAGGLLPGMQESTGMMFDVQPGAGRLTKMDAGTARTIYDVDPSKTAGEFRAGDIVQDADGKQHTVSGANMRSKIVTDKGRILDPKDVVRVAKQETLFQRAEPVDTPAFKRWFGNSKVVDENGRPLVVYHGTPRGNDITEFAKNYPTDGIYFTSDTQVAAGYTTEARAKDPDQSVLFEQTGSIYPVYLQAERPLILGIEDAEDFRSRAFDTEFLKKDGYDSVIIDYGDGEKEFMVFEPAQIKSKFNRGTFDPNNPNILFQEADLPIGSIEEAGQQPPHHEAMSEGYSEHIRPLMEAMQKVAREQAGNKPLDGAMRDLSPEGAAMLKKYRNQVNVDMAGTKNAATKWGEQSRDFAMLNYNKRYGIDRYIETIYPYQFFYTRSLATWAARAIDKPAIFSQYARIKRQQDRYERDIPERLRGKIKISLPWLPDWMGDALYIDPMKSLFTPLNYARPFERMIQDTSYQQLEAERILQEWASDGTVAEKDIVDAIKNREGATWERAYSEAQIRRESEIQNPMDFMNAMLGPAWYLTTPYKLLKGEQAGIGSTPILNTTRALDTVTQGTWAQPIGDLIGMIGKPEEMLRQKLNIPEFGEYGDYYVDRTLANMVADGVISSDEAQRAMIERTGATFDEARERVKMELAMRVPTASALLAGLTADNFVQGVARVAMTAPVSLFGAGILPSGELEYRGLKQEWNEAWKRKDAGDDKAITQFFDDHPEYEAYLSKGKEPEERLRGYLVGQIWDGYMGLGTTDRKTANAELGEEFKRDFLDTETRSFEGIDIEQLAQWAQMLNQSVPKTAATANAIAQPAPKIKTYDPNVTKVTDQYFRLRGEQFPNYYEVEQGYFAIPKSERASYMREHPELKKYWDFKDKWQKAYPEYEPIIRGQVFKRIDTSQWSPLLLDYVGMYAMTGEPLGKGAWKALEQQWIMAGSPYGDVKSWLNSQVVPALLYSGGEP